MSADLHMARNDGRGTTCPVVPGAEIVGQVTAIGGAAEAQELPDFCAAHGIVAECELTPVQRISEAFERMEQGDMRYRFVIDLASLDPAA